METQRMESATGRIAKGQRNTSRMLSCRRGDGGISKDGGDKGNADRRSVCVTVHLCDTHTDNTKADNTAHCPRSNRHTPSAHWAIYCPSARRRHVRSHAAPRAEGTLVRDMRNVIRKRWCRPRSCPRREQARLVTAPRNQWSLAANEDKSQELCPRRNGPR